MELLTERYEDEINGVLSCYDRVIIQGTLPMFCYADGMTSFLNSKKIREARVSPWSCPYLFSYGNVSIL